MKGLLKSNFLAVCSNIKVFSALMLILGAIAAAAINTTFLIIYVLLSMAGFSVISAAGVKRDFAAKWGKYKLTLPVKRAEIVKSCYISQLIWLIVGAVFAGASVSLSWLLHGCPFDNSIDTLSVFALGISANLFTAAFFFPMFYLAGEEKGEVILIISLLCGIGILLGIISILNLCLTPGLTAVITGSAVLVVCSLSAFVLSYPLAVSIYEGKDY